MSIADRLRQGIESLGMKNLKDVAARCGIPYRSMQNYLSGEREPNAEGLTLISTRLGISVDWLLTGTGQPMRGESGQLAVAPTPASTLGSRLREEREAIGLTQEQLSELAWGKKSGSSLQQLIEEDQKAPTDTYLLGAAIAGIDALYVLSGERSQPIPPGFESRVAALTECTRQSEKLAFDGPHLVEALYVSRENATREAAGPNYRPKSAGTGQPSVNVSSTVSGTWPVRGKRG